MWFYPPYVKPIVEEELLITGSVWLSSLSTYSAPPSRDGDSLKLFHGARRSHGSEEENVARDLEIWMANSLQQSV